MRFSLWRLFTRLPTLGREADDAEDMLADSSSAAGPEKGRGYLRVPATGFASASRWFPSGQLDPRGARCFSGLQPSSRRRLEEP